MPRVLKRTQIIDSSSSRIVNWNWYEVVVLAVVAMVPVLDVWWDYTLFYANRIRFFEPG